MNNFLARISHQLSTTTTYLTESPGVLGFCTLNVLSSTLRVLKPVVAWIFSKLRGLVTNSGEKCGLKLFLSLTFLFHSYVFADVTLCAASSLKDVLTELTQKHSQEQIHLNFGASNSLARQIASGAPCDLFFSASLDSLKNLKPILQKNLLSNHLVLIVPFQSSFKVSEPTNFLTNEKVQKIAIAQESAPAGHYAKVYLTKLGLFPKIVSKLVSLPNVRATLAMVERGNVDAGFVYMTDAHQSNKVHVIFTVKDPGEPIVYPLVLLKDKGTDLFHYLASQKALEVYQKAGFLMFKQNV